MKWKQIGWACALSLILGCASPGEKERAMRTDQWMQASGKVKILTTTAMIQQLVQLVGQERVDCLSLITGAIDPHHYELVKGDREKIDRADVIICNGVGLECGASLRAALERENKALFLGEAIFSEHPEQAIRIEGVIDPHIWMDAELFSFGVDPIVELLIRKDPAGAAVYRRQGDEAKAALQAFSRRMSEKMKQVPQEKRFLITSHDAFNYFTKKYLAEPGEEEWQRRTLAPEGLVPEGQLSVLDLQRVCDFLCSHQLAVVFSESNMSQNALKKVIAICSEQGLEVKLADAPLYGDAMAERGEESGAYFRMVEHNIDTLVSHLSQ